MGNRAVVIFTENEGNRISPCVYLHWNGGPESVYAFLDEFKRRKYGHDADYDAARFAHIVAEFFDKDGFSSTSIGISNGPSSLSRIELNGHNPGDNGIYIFNRNGNDFTIRRYNGNNEPFSPEQVDEEIEIAQGMDKFHGILEDFKESTGDKISNG